jgi:N-acetylmuramoyl-L-alanine amidase
MNKVSIALMLVALLPCAAGGQAPGVSVDTLYADAKAKEKAVRAALTDPAATSSVLKAVRTVVNDYEAIVRRFPTSAFSDDALWFAGWLAFDAFERFHDEHERAAGVRLWRALASQYPVSKLAKQVPQQLAKVETATGAAVAAPAPPPRAPAPPSQVPAPPSRASVAAASARPPAARPVPARTGLATLKGIRRTVLADTVRITIELDREIAFREERLASPARVFVDLSATQPSAELVDRTIRFEGDAEHVRQIRVGRQANNTTRVVLDIADVSSYSVYPLYNPYRLVIDSLRDGARAPHDARLVAPPLPALLAGRSAGPLFNRSLPAAPAGIAGIAPPNTSGMPPLTARAMAPALAPAVIVPGGPIAGAVLSPPAANVGGGFSMARQLGLGVSRIVIDPGHGGHDPGATGTGVTEASVVLDVALRLERMLANVPGVEVILTRRTDDFISLQERTAIANREGADLFLSIHANASSNLRAQGVETYFLNFATTSTAAAVAARENASSGQPMAALPDFVKAIALHNKLDESRELATHVQSAMVERLSGANGNLKNLGVKQAPFVVLIGASMPSVLAEISFVTNAQEVKLLRATSYRQRIAEALFNAIRKYQASLKTEAKMAQ